MKKMFKLQFSCVSGKSPFLLNLKKIYTGSSGSSGQVRWGEKHEIYAAFGGHLFMTIFTGWPGGRHGPLGPPGSATDWGEDKFEFRVYVALGLRLREFNGGAHNI